MKTSSTGNFRTTTGKIVLGLVLAALVGSIDVAPAAGREQRDNERYEQGRGHDRDHFEGRRDYRPYGNRGRAYAPPRGIYVPPSPPGISIFFPPIIIHP
jgi:hypothetical protein